MTDLQRAQAEQAAAEAMIREGGEHSIVNGKAQPLHSWLTWMADQAMEAEAIQERLIHADFACARAASVGDRG